MARDLNRRTFLREGATAALGISVLPSAVWSRPSFDLVIRGGIAVDGTGGPPFKADLGLAADRIAAVGNIDPAQGRRVIDASGLYVAPGFIDIHTHSDGDILEYPTADSRVRQGVTTEVTGNCGGSAAPAFREPKGRDDPEDVAPAGTPSWTSVESYFQVLEGTGISLNHALLVGQGTIRESVAGEEDRPLSAQEMARVLSVLEEALDQGAMGLSTGLEYVPGRFTPTEEIVAMARVVARRGGLYASHVRNEETMLLEAVDEAIRIGREAGARVQISHLKAAGTPNWGKQVAALDLLEGARVAGVEVLGDAYPYTAYSTGLTIFMPAWAMDGGWEALAQRLGDSQERGRIRSEVVRRVRQEPGDYDLIVINRVRTEAGKAMVGKNLAEIASERGAQPVDALLGILMEEDGSVGYIGHAMSRENVEMVLSHPLVMVGSDGSSMAPVGEAARSRPHPRSYGTFPRILGHYCRERGLFDLATAVKKMTSMPADQIGIPDRGRIARGKKADLVVFDPGTVRDEATFEDPHRFPTGIHHVLVNGEVVVKDGEHTGARPGTVIRGG
ncbi:MAG: N-acyl-D-amino-acid deacylase family protein [Longimicrobiales bacterium]